MHFQKRLIKIRKRSAKRAKRVPKSQWSEAVLRNRKVVLDEGHRVGNG